MSAKDLLALLPVIYQTENWFIEWKSRIEKKKSKSSQTEWNSQIFHISNFHLKIATFPTQKIEAADN